MSGDCCSLPKNWKFKTFQNEDGKCIRYGYAEPEEEVRGTVVILPGYSLHAETYVDQIKFYLERGFAVYTKDWAGQGGSERLDKDDPMNPGTQGMEKHVRDLHQFIKETVKPNAKGPLIMSAHSMGGHVGLSYLRKHPGHFDMAIMASPMLDFFAPNRFLRWAFKTTAAVITKLGGQNWRLPRLENPRQWFKEKFKRVRKSLRSFNSPVRLVIENNEKDCKKLEELKLGDPTWGWINATYRSIEELNDAMFLQKVDKIPILMVGAGNEDIVENSAIKRAASHIGKSATYIEIEDAAHGLWYSGDEGSKKFIKIVDDFVEKNMKAYHGVGCLRQQISQVFQRLSAKEKYEIRQTHTRQLRNRGYQPPPAFKPRPSRRRRSNKKTPTPMV